MDKIYEGRNNLIVEKNFQLKNMKAWSDEIKTQREAFRKKDDKDMDWDEVQEISFIDADGDYR